MYMYRMLTLFLPRPSPQMRYVRNHLDELAGKPHSHGENMLLLVEHTPVYTVGTRDKAYSTGEGQVQALTARGGRECVYSALKVELSWCSKGYVIMYINNDKRRLWYYLHANVFFFGVNNTYIC